jgi:hypothetical protein
VPWSPPLKGASIESACGATRRVGRVLEGAFWRCSGNAPVVPLRGLTMFLSELCRGATQMMVNRAIGEHHQGEARGT